MGRYAELTEKDLELLGLISKSGVITLKQAQQIYGGSKWYHYDRVQTLKKRGYLQKKSGYIELTNKGASLFNQNRYRYKEDYLKGLRADMAEIIMNLGNWNIISVSQAKHKHNLNQRIYFKCLLSHNNLEYAIYMLGEKPKKQTLAPIKGEIKFLAHGTNIDRAIVFGASDESLSMFGNDELGMKELLLLKYPDSLPVLNNYQKLKEHAELLFGSQQLVVTDRPFADYETKDGFVTFLMLNDLVKMNNLYNYLHLPHKIKKVTIVCLSSREEIMRQMYRKSELVVIDEQGILALKPKRTKKSRETQVEKLEGELRETELPVRSQQTRVEGITEETKKDSSFLQIKFGN